MSKSLFGAGASGEKDSGFRPRTHSDPDLPQLLPVPVRPHSSYESKPQQKEYTQFEPEVLQAMSSALGLNLEKQTEYHWIIRDCLLALKDEGWMCVVNDETGDLTFIHAATEECRSFHPTVAIHRSLAERLIFLGKELHSKRRDRHYLVKEAVFKACFGTKDVRKCCSPRLLEHLFDLLGVDPHAETYLITRVKTAVEDAYFHIREIGMQHITVDSIIDVNGLLIQLELDRVEFLRKISPSGLLYCVECETALADVADASTHDLFCNACFVGTHSTGHRLDAPGVFIEQVVCSECEVRSAVVRCQDCQDLFCTDCFHLTHKVGKRAKHCVRLPMTTFCFECDIREASYICMECEDVLCPLCCHRIHRKGARQNHTVCGLRKAAYTKKLFANNMDSIMTILNKNIRQRQSLSPWLLLYDEALNPFWYNFQSRESVRAAEHDLIHAPVSAADSEVPLDDLSGLPADLLVTHAAKIAAGGAVFYVPPPMHIKFASPATACDSLAASMFVSRSDDVRNELKGGAQTTVDSRFADTSGMKAKDITPGDVESKMK